jgi:hypothetical protein
MLTTCALGIGLTLAGARAHAGEGVIELNDTCAKGSGCLPGDSPGLPIQINAPGSYRLTSDILGNALAYDAIVEINAEAVTLDLNGFSIVGSGAGSGSKGAIFGGHRVTVRNGFVRFAANDGVQLGGSSRVDDLHVHGSGRDGVRIAGEGSVRNVVATSNGGNGITAGAASVIDGCTATANGGSGISLPSGTVRGSTATQNSDRGGDFGPGVAYSTNVFSANGVGDIAYGHASGGNICSDSSCTADGRRRYYLTPASYSGAFREDAWCDLGYHPASIVELVDPSELAYDFGRGRDGGTIAPGRRLVPGDYGGCTPRRPTPWVRFRPERLSAPAGRPTPTRLQP